MKSSYINILFVFLIISNFMFAQEIDDWRISGQIQLRSELDGRDFSNKTYPLTFTSLRTRVGIEKSFANKVNLFVQLQDSRIFGQEPGREA